MKNNPTTRISKNNIHARLSLLAGCVAALAFALTARAEFSISQGCFATGGGRSTGGNYELCSTIGLPMTHQSATTGNYKLTAGFLGVAVVSVADAPVLKMAPASPGHVTLSWESADSGWVLQETISLSSPSWVNSPSGSSNPATVPATGAMKFYRLHKP